MTSTSLTLRCIGRRADTHDVVSWQFVLVTAVSGHFWLTLKKSGKKVKILPGQTLLVALEGAGETMMAACRAGVCDACRCTTTGEIQRQSRVTLTPQDIERGVALACSCTARGDVSLDY
jgi:NADH oxidoreductase Hcr